MSDNIVVQAHERDGLGGSLELQANKHGDLYTAMGLPPYTYLVNSGCVWRAKSATTACVIAYPTTASIFTLQNNAGDGGVSFVIIDFFASCLVADAFVQPAHIIYTVNGARVAAKTASVTPYNAKARASTYAGSAILPAPGANVVDNGWFPVSNSTDQSIASLGGQGIYVRIDGLIVLPPGGLLGASVLGADVTFTYQLGATWAEVQL